MEPVQPLRERPLLFQLDDFCAPDDVAALQAALADERLAAGGLALRPSGATGRTAEVPPTLDPALAALARRIDALVGVESGDQPFRFRRAAPGDAHPLHLDDYRVGARRLRITAHLYLTAVDGGRTVFPDAQPPLAVAPQPGRLVVWFQHTADGRPDPHGLHGFEPHAAGERVALTRFVYLTPAELALALTRSRRTSPPPLLAALARHYPDPIRVPPDPDGVPGPDEGPPAAAAARGRLLAGGAPRDGGHGAPSARLRTALDVAEGRPTLVCVVDRRNTAGETRRLLAAAGAARGVPYWEADAEALDPTSPPLPDGTLLYGAGAGLDAVRVERQLWQPGVVTLHRDPAGPFRVLADQPLAFARAGLPVPRTVWLRQADPAELARVAAHLGGFPVVVRVEGGEGGLGVMRADSLPALTSMVDWLTRTGHTPRLVAHVPDAVHWRVIVLGDRVLTAYRNPLREGDFRSEPSADPADYGLTPPPEVARLAVAATQLNGPAFAGVDVLTHPSGRCYVLEANFPCYFPQAQQAPGVDVAGAILDFLLARAGAAPATLRTAV